jgi:uncharacterized protein (DUF305 family)
MTTANREPGSATGGSIRTKFLVAGLAVAALIAVGAAGVSYAHGNGQVISMMSGGMGSTMMGGDGMESMMGNDAMGSMMDGGMMGGDQMQAIGSFGEDRPFDLQFIDQMTMHHEGAIKSSEHMISDSKRPELRELAQNIEESQSEQIKQMQGWRDKWYPDAEQTSGMPAGEMEEMMGDGTMERMMGGSMREMMGDDTTDEMFLEMMIPHHQLAVNMSEKALTEAEHPELKDLAQKIRDEQLAEIELMKGYLDEIEKADGR